MGLRKHDFGKEKKKRPCLSLDSTRKKMVLPFNLRTDLYLVILLSLLNINLGLGLLPTLFLLLFVCFSSSPLMYMSSHGKNFPLEIWIQVISLLSGLRKDWALLYAEAMNSLSALTCLQPQLIQSNWWLHKDYILLSQLTAWMWVLKWNG